MLDAIILDTESTQKKDLPERPNEPIEVAFASWPDDTIAECRRYKPRHPPAWGAISVHGIGMQDLEGCTPANQAIFEVPKARYWIGHNIDFDWHVMGRPPVQRICTLALSRSVHPTLDSHTLSTMIYYLRGVNDATRKLLRDAHSAAHDVMLCRILLTHLCEELNTHDLAALYELSEEARIPKKMSFGKFADQPISAVDRGYAAWYARQPDPDPYVLVAFRRAGLLR